MLDDVRKLVTHLFMIEDAVSMFEISMVDPKSRAMQVMCDSSLCLTWAVVMIKGMFMTVIYLCVRGRNVFYQSLTEKSKYCE